MITLLTRFNYNPIKQLKNFAEEKLGTSLNTINELEAVKVTISSILEDSSRLQERIRSSQPAVKEFVLSNFLTGNFKDINEFNEKAQEAGLLFTYTFYQVAIFHFSPVDSFRKNCGDIAGYLEASLPESIEGYCRKDTDGSRIILALSANEEGAPQVKTVLEQIHRQILLQWKQNCTIGIGNLYADIGQIWKSYIEASTAVDYRLIKGNNKVIFFSDIEPYNMDIDLYPKQKIESIAVCIKNGTTDRLREIVNDILIRVKDNNTSLFMTRCICFDIINSLMKVMYDINKTYVTKPNRNFDLKSLIEFDTVEELAETVKILCTDICDYIQSGPAQKDSDAIARICAHINENYYKPNFSLQNTADCFGMSLANFSQYFKSRTGKTLSEYVNYLQMEKAKELLLETDDPLQSIIERVGFYNTSNFIRKFKHEVGVTPGEFRKSQSPSS